MKSDEASPTADWDPTPSDVRADSRAAHDELLRRCPVARDRGAGQALADGEAAFEVSSDLRVTSVVDQVDAGIDVGARAKDELVLSTIPALGLGRDPERTPILPQVSDQLRCDGHVSHAQLVATVGDKASKARRG